MGLLDLTPQFGHDFALRKYLGFDIIFANNTVTQCLQFSVMLIHVGLFSITFYKPLTDKTWKSRIYTRLV